MTSWFDASLEKLRSRAGALEVYLDKRVISILFLGFSSGLPLMLVLRTLSAWLQEEGVDKATIGLFAFTFAPYTFKFAWAPFMDRLPLPVLTRLFGRRRGWLLLTQACLIGAIFGLGQTSPGQDLFMTAVMALLVSFFSASQDVVIDAYRIEILPQHQLGAGAANVVTGYRIGMWVAGAGALWLADLAGWSIAYAAMALLDPGGRRRRLAQSRTGGGRLGARGGAAPCGLTDHRQLAGLMLLAVLLGAFIGLLIGASYGPRSGWIGGVVVAAILAGLFATFGNSPAFRQAVIDPFRDFLRAQRADRGPGHLELHFPVQGERCPAHLDGQSVLSRDRLQQEPDRLGVRDLRLLRHLLRRLWCRRPDLPHRHPAGAVDQRRS